MTSHVGLCWSTRTAVLEVHYLSGKLPRVEEEVSKDQRFGRCDASLFRPKNFPRFPRHRHNIATGRCWGCSRIGLLLSEKKD